MKAYLICLAGMGMGATLPAVATVVPDAPVLAASVELMTGFERHKNVAVFFDDFDVVRAVNPVVRDTTYAGATLGLDLDVPLQEGRAWVGTADIEIRRARQLASLDRDRLRLSTGLALPLGTGDAEFLLIIDALDLGGGDFRRRGIGLQSSYLLRSEQHRGKLTLEWLRYRHAGLDDLYDSDRYGVRYAHRTGFAGSWQPALRLRVGWGADINRWRFDDLSAQEWLAEAEVSVTPSSAWNLSAAVAGRRTRFLGPAPGLALTRRDHRGSLKLAAQLNFDKQRNVRCEAEQVQRTSNDPLAEASLRRLGCTMEWNF